VSEEAYRGRGCRQRPAIGDGRFYQISELTVFALVSVVAC